MSPNFEISCAEMVVEQKEMLEMALSICRGYLSGAWRRITAQDICVKRMSGGLTNMLYHVTLLSPPTQRGHPNDSEDSRHRPEPTEVLLRIYGQTHGEREVESVITDSVIFTLLSERRLGPTLHGVFPGGRIEEYIPARCLKFSELTDPRVSLKIAEKMADIHLMQIPVIKEPCWLWDTIQRWLNNLYTKTPKPAANQNGETLATECHKKNKIHMKKILSKDLNMEADWLKKHLIKIKSPVVFSHNDMQEGNILFRETQDNNNVDLVVIDFEYCSYNYRAFDIANHFMETVYDYSYKPFPHFSIKRENCIPYNLRRAFVEAYLARMNDSTSPDIVLEEVKHFSLASHFLWALWSFIHDENSEITFGYWEYGLERLNAYYRLKQQLTPPTETNAIKRKASTDLD